MTARAVGAFLLVLVAGGCTSRAGRAGPASPEPAAASPVQGAADRDRPADPAPQEIDLEPVRVRVVPPGEGAADGAGQGGRPTIVMYDARDLFDQAVAAQRGESWDLALELYDRMLSEFPGSALAPAAQFNAGLALEGKGELAAAVDRYRDVARRAPGTRDALDARIRAGAVLVELGRLPDALAAFDAILAARGLSELDRLELLARRGHVLVEMKSYPEAEKTLGSAIDRASRLSGGAALRHYVGMSHYYLGEIPRRQAQAIELRLPDEQLAIDLEARSKLVLLAQERYQATIAAGNLHWATAAGYQLASMQEEMWRALVTAPVPPQLSAEESRIYIDEVRQLARAHLERALEVHTRTVEIAERLAARSRWSEASRARVPVLSEMLAREARGEPVPPEALGDPGAGPAPAADPDRYVPPRLEL